ncbi:MAG: hypothetical protein N2C14_18735 [Planctomycetales bacterium]
MIHHFVALAFELAQLSTREKPSRQGGEFVAGTAWFNERNP